MRNLPSFLVLPALAILCCLFALNCAQHGYRNEPVDGIDGMEWATSLVDVGGVARTEKFSGDTVYLEPLDGYCDACKTYVRLDSAERGEEAYYLACHDELCGKITFLDGQGEQPAMESLVAKHGKPQRRDSGQISSAFWTGKKADLELRTGGLFASAPLRIYAYKPLLLEMTARHKK